MRCSQVLFGAVGILLLSSHFAVAMFMPGERVPIDRLLQNVRARLSDYPNPDQAQYLLGRLESLAFSSKVTTVNVMRSRDPNELPRLAGADPVKPGARRP